MDPYSSYGYSTGPAYPGASGAGPSTSYGAAAAGPSGAGAAAYSTADWEYNMGALAQQSAYIPGAVQPQHTAGPLRKGEKRTTVLRKGAGEQWEDPTLLEWDPSHFRLFVGNVSNDVGDQVLADAFSKYPTFEKARIIRDRISNKAKYGFVSFRDPEDFLKAWKEMNGKYVGNRPIKLEKATTKIQKTDIGSRKARELEAKKKLPGGKLRSKKPY